MIRFTTALLAFISALFAPVWVTVIIGGILAVVWEAWEVIILGVVVDLLYAPAGGFFYIPMPATITAIALVWVMIPLRKRLFVE